MLLSLILGIAIGAVMGLTGAGGGILAVPALVAGMGWSMQQAAPVALIAVGAAAALGALESFRHGLVRYRAALFMALIGFPFAVLGSTLARSLSQPLLMGLFSIVLLFAAYRMALRGSGRVEQEERPRNKAGQVDPETGRFHWDGPTFFLVGVIGALTGMMSGLLGVGGGFVIVPMLRRYTNLTMHGIVATSLFLIALVSVSSIGLALSQGVSLPLAFCLYFVVATAVGMAGGRIMAHRLPEHKVQWGFAFVLTCVALGLAVKAIGTITGIV
ncbi:MAG: sulfite exporter TauE/SafE family protein [Burkholderiaceae bacterium]|nr:sulfite exporter TauE/SafE family protein [Burkholderiaceae bacterium]